MTIEEIQALQLTLLSDGFALCSKDDPQPVRKITEQEITAMMAAKYYNHTQQHPDDKIMLMPLDDKGNALAIGFAHITVTVPDASPSGNPAIVPEALASGKKRKPKSATSRKAAKKK